MIDRSIDQPIRLADMTIAWYCNFWQAGLALSDVNMNSSSQKSMLVEDHMICYVQRIYVDRGFPSPLIMNPQTPTLSTRPLGEVNLRSVR
jgi:hypothetical protein